MSQQGKVQLMFVCWDFARNILDYLMKDDNFSLIILHFIA